MQSESATLRISSSSGILITFQQPNTITKGFPCTGRQISNHIMSLSQHLKIGNVFISCYIRVVRCERLLPEPMDSLFPVPGDTETRPVFAQVSKAAAVSV